MSHYHVDYRGRIPDPSKGTEQLMKKVDYKVDKFCWEERQQGRMGWEVNRQPLRTEYLEKILTRRGLLKKKTAHQVEGLLAYLYIKESVEGSFSDDYSKQSERARRLLTRRFKAKTAEIIILDWSERIGHDYDNMYDI